MLTDSLTEITDTPQAHIEDMFDIACRAVKRQQPVPAPRVGRAARGIDAH
jgi:hypothetical protein